MTPKGPPRTVLHGSGARAEPKVKREGRQVQAGYGSGARPVMVRHPNVMGALSRYLVAAVAIGVLAAAVWMFSDLLGAASTVTP